MRFLNYIVLGIFVICGLVLFWNRRPKMKYGEILPAHEMRDKYGINSDDYIAPTLDPNKVPEDLRDIIPFAATWGIPDDVIRMDFEEKATESGKQKFKSALTGRTQKINQWLDTFGKDKPMSEEAACFMYMLQALDETGLWPDKPEPPTP